jgi:hypothetical protein
VIRVEEQTLGATFTSIFPMGPVANKLHAAPRVEHTTRGFSIGSSLTTEAMRAFSDLKQATNFLDVKIRPFCLVLISGVLLFLLFIIVFQLFFKLGLRKLDRRFLIMRWSVSARWLSRWRF